MIDIKVGQAISLADAKSGTSSRGAYMLVPVKEEKGYNRVTVWADNPDQAANFRGTAIIEKITKVSLGRRQYQDKWYDDFSCRAVLKQGNADPVIFEQVSLADDDELPFK